MSEVPAAGSGQDGDIDDVVALRRALADAQEQVVDSYLRRITQDGNPVAEGAQEVVRTTARSLLAPAITGEPGADRLGRAAGQRVGTSHLSPVHAVRAIKVMGQIASDVLVETDIERDLSVHAVAQVLSDLHQGLMNRVLTAAMPWAAALLEQVHTAHIAERQRIARDLHDQVAHMLTIAVHRSDRRRSGRACRRTPRPVRCRARLGRGRVLLRRP